MVFDNATYRPLASSRSIQFLTTQLKASYISEERHPQRMDRISVGRRPSIHNLVLAIRYSLHDPLGAVSATGFSPARQIPEPSLNDATQEERGSVFANRQSLIADQWPRLVTAHPVGNLHIGYGSQVGVDDHSDRDRPVERAKPQKTVDPSLPVTPRQLPKRWLAERLQVLRVPFR